MTVSIAGRGAHLCERVCEVLEDQDRPGAGVLELVLELARRVERVGVHHRETGVEGGCERHGVLQDVGQHDRQPVALPEARHLLQVGRELAAQPVEIPVGQRAVHQRAGRLIGVFLAASRDERLQRGDLVGVDVGRHACRIAPEPDLFHSVSPGPRTRPVNPADPRATYLYSSAGGAFHRLSSGSSSGHTSSSSLGWAAALGCRPSSCISESSSAMPSRKNGTSGSSWRFARSPYSAWKAPA